MKKEESNIFLEATEDDKPRVKLMKFRHFLHIHRTEAL